MKATEEFAIISKMAVVGHLADAPIVTEYSTSNAWERNAIRKKPNTLAAICTIRSGLLLSRKNKMLQEKDHVKNNRKKISIKI